MDSRLESNSDTNRIHISEQTAAMLGDTFHIEHRGMIQNKGKGNVHTYFLTGRRTSPAAFKTTFNSISSLEHQ